MQKDDCIFCKIVKREIPCVKIYEDKNFMAFLDVKPVSDGHLLVIPKKHYIWMQDVDDKTISEIFKLTKKIMLAIKKGLKCDFVQMGVVGNEIPHFHIHLMPRHYGDNFRNFPTKEYNKKEEKKIIQRIISML